MSAVAWRDSQSCRKAKQPQTRFRPGPPLGHGCNGYRPLRPAAEGARRRDATSSTLCGGCTAVDDASGQECRGCRGCHERHERHASDERDLAGYRRQVTRGTVVGGPWLSSRRGSTPAPAGGRGDRPAGRNWRGSWRCDGEDGRARKGAQAGHQRDAGDRGFYPRACRGVDPAGAVTHRANQGRNDLGRGLGPVAAAGRPAGRALSAGCVAHRLQSI
jgi:hypothetical protein